MNVDPAEYADLFTCQICGKCCRGFGGTYVDEENIRAIARFTGCSEKQLRASHITRSGDKFVIGQATDGFCLFFDHETMGCAIHPVKPRMCASWPFIPALLKDIQNWKIMANSCPGINADAPEDQIISMTLKVLKSFDE